MRNVRFLAVLCTAAVLGVCAALPRGAPVQPVRAEMPHRIYFAVGAVNVDLFNLPAAPQATDIPSTPTALALTYRTGLLARVDRSCNGNVVSRFELQNCDGTHMATLSCSEGLCGQFVGYSVRVGSNQHMNCLVGVDQFAAWVVETIDRAACPPASPTATPTPPLAPSASAPPPQVTPPDNTPTPTLDVPTPVVTTPPFVVKMPCTGKMIAEFARLIHIDPEHLVQTGKTKVGDSADVARDGCKVNLEEGPWDGIQLPVELQGTLRFDFEGQPVVAYYGKDGLVFDNVLGGTFRFRPFHVANGPVTNWEEDPCKLMEHEEGFGQDNAFPYHTIDGNVGCASHLLKLVTVAGCPQTMADAVTLLGGRQSDWKSLGFTSSRLYVAWKFNANGRTDTDLRWPGWGDFDHWKWGMAVRGPLPPAGSRPEEYVDEATFNCRN